jgi:hypothetical protein
MSPFLCVLVIFEIGSWFVPVVVWIMSLLLVLPYAAGMAGMYHHTQPLVGKEIHELFPWLTLN